MYTVKLLLGTTAYDRQVIAKRFYALSHIHKDLYSAYLLSNSRKDLKGPNRKKCAAGFGGFCGLMDEKISDLKKKGISMRQCFGF